MPYVTTREACRRLGCHPNTLRNWADEGKIAVIRTPGGYRRYDVDAFLRARGDSAIVCYVRVSSAKQRDDLARQIAFLRKRFPQAEIVEDIGSGLNFKRRGLRALLERALRGDKLKVVVAHRDRLCRFGFDLIRFVIERSGGEIVVLDDTKASPDRELVDDLFAIVHVFSRRLNGRRNSRRQKDQDLPQGRAESVLQELARLRALRFQPDG